MVPAGSTINVDLSMAEWELAQPGARKIAQKIVHQEPIGRGIHGQIILSGRDYYVRFVGPGGDERTLPRSYFPYITAEVALLREAVRINQVPARA